MAKIMILFVRIWPTGIYDVVIVTEAVITGAIQTSGPVSRP